MPIALDTSFVIAACCAWHPAFSICRDALLERPVEPLILPVHVMAESFSVLTRLPRPRRLPPNLAWRLLEERFFSKCAAASLEKQDLANAVAACRDAGAAGGRVYDALIAASAARAGATVLWTLNPKHFLAVAPQGLAVMRPGGA
ncbi:MAG: PIN domain-containing protein [Acidobacteria bacterium]|nr:PIN domain-containing protein [Acidobacteriota bacterium]